MEMGMRLAIISDIHGNMDALSKVIEDFNKSDIDAVVCLGDCIGYGPEPEEVLNCIHGLNIPTTIGNHELTVTDRRNLEWFNPIARQSLQITLGLLSNDAIEFICTMKTYLVMYGCRFVHGFPPRSVITYLFQVSEIGLQSIFKHMPERICFVGHTHELQLVGWTGEKVEYALLAEGVVELNKDKKYIVNVGSVGQPRDGDNSAKYVIWDMAEDTLEVRFVPYDIAAVAEKIIKIGLPEAHAHRLW